MSKKKDSTREAEVLLAVYTFDMNKLSKAMEQAKDYDELAGIYEEAAKLIRKYASDSKGLEDGK